ncbi:hypothetical protein WE348_21730 (plasmid) [Alteromonas macleodii]|uniref:hypothetical protein n=1 Tax=Alteromonas macleodii TaxID=28108 RepID=UPI0030D277BD
MANKIRPFGIYKVNPASVSPSGYDVADCQDLLPQGERIRNKKLKRRRHNKMARAAAKQALNKELTVA